MKDVIEWRDASKELPEVSFYDHTLEGEDWLISDLCLIKTKNGNYGMTVLDCFVAKDGKETKEWYLEDAGANILADDKVIYWTYPKDIIIKN